MAGVITVSLVAGVWFSHQPLWHTDLWDHVNYGRLILETKELSATEPLLELAQSEPFIHTAWGSKVLLAMIADAGRHGLVALQSAHGFCVWAAVAVITLCVVRRSRSAAWGVIGGGIFVALNWQQFPVIRPQLAGVLLYCVVLATLLLRTRLSTPARCGLIGLFVVWANLHGSFAMGLLLMGLVMTGRAADVYFARQLLRDVLRCRPLHSLLMLTVACTVATLVNPGTYRIYPELFRVAHHPNVASMFEWAPLSLQMKQGKVAAVVAAVLVILCLLSPRRKRLAEMLPLLVMTILTLWSSRMINWLAPIAAWVIGIHGAAAWRRWTARRASTDGQRRMYWTVATLLIGLIACAATPLGQALLTQRVPEPSQSLARATPIETAEFLASYTSLPEGRALLPAGWAGYLMRHGGPHLRPMVNLHVHMIPPAVWQDYLSLIRGRQRWEQILTRYNLNLIVTDRYNHGPLIKHLQHSHQFQQIFKSQLAEIFVRTIENPQDRP